MKHSNSRRSPPVVHHNPEELAEILKLSSSKSRVNEALDRFRLVHQLNRKHLHHRSASRVFIILTLSLALAFAGLFVIALRGFA